MELAALVRQHRKAKKQTQDALGRASGLSESFVSLIETGRRGLSFESAEALADALGLTDDERDELHTARRVFAQEGAEPDSAPTMNEVIVRLDHVTGLLEQVVKQLEQVAQQREPAQ